MTRILTLKRTQKRHRELWMWIAEETRKRKEKVKKDDFFLKHKEYEIPDNFCWCCEFDKQHSFTVKTNHCYILCPIEKWGRNVKHCGDESSPYRAWRKETDWRKSADLAEKIANLPFKKAFDITPEQAKLLRDKGFGKIYSVEEEVCKKAWTLKDVQKKHKKLRGNSFNP